MVTYDGTYINVGNGLDLSSGKFKAPVAGTYAIHFNALATVRPMPTNPDFATSIGYQAYSAVRLFHNGKQVSASYSDFSRRVSIKITIYNDSHLKFLLIANNRIE